MRTKLLVPKLALATRGAATAATRKKIRGDISSVFPSLSGILRLPLPDQYAELKSLFSTGRERVQAESWEKLLLSGEKEEAAMKKLGSDVCLFPLIPSFPLMTWRS